MKNRIFFFKTGSNSQKNPFIAKELSRGFPECAVRTVDVIEDILDRSPWARVQALGEALLRHGRAVVRQRQNPRTFYPKLTTTHRAIERWVRREVDPADTCFTFVNQSLFPGFRNGVPGFVYTDHTHLANGRYPAVPFRPDEEWLIGERPIYLRAAHCFTTSQFARRSLIEDYHLPPARVSCVYSGANAVPASLPARTSFHQRILFVGVEWERKGGPELLAAFAKVRAQFPEAQLWIAGCSPRAPQARVLGRLPLEELSALYREADIFCLPSRKDPSAIALAEAAMAGLPVVATDVGGSADRVIDGESGYLVPQGDSTALASRLAELLTHPERCRELGARGFALAQERFTWTAVGDRLTRVIRENLGER